MPPCWECEAYEENEPEFVAREICPGCPWRQEEGDSPLLAKLIRFIDLQRAGCPVGRHELTDDEWCLLGRLKRERDLILKKGTGQPEDGDHQ